MTATFNLSELFEQVADVAADRTALVVGRPPPHLPGARRAGQPPRPPPRRRRRRTGRPHRPAPPEQHGVPRGDAGRVQAAGGPGEHQLPVRRPRARAPLRDDGPGRPGGPPPVRRRGCARPPTAIRDHAHLRGRRRRQRRSPCPRVGPTTTPRWPVASPARDFTGRTSDDLYCACTGGTTGMPKGVMWRHEDIFFASLGGGGMLQGPIQRPEELSDRVTEVGVAMLVTPPLMHVSAHWAAFQTLFGGGKVVMTRSRLVRPSGRLGPHRVRAGEHRGDRRQRDGRAADRSLPRAPRRCVVDDGLRVRRCGAVTGGEAAHAGGPPERVGDGRLRVDRDRRGRHRRRRRGGWQGHGRGVHDGREHRGARRAAPADRAGQRRDRQARPPRPHPDRLLPGRREDGRHVRRGGRRALGAARRPRQRGAGRLDPPARSGSASINTGGEKVFPEEVESALHGPRRGGRRAGRGRARRPLGRAGGRGRPAACGPGGQLRGAAGACPRPPGRLQGAPGDGRGRPDRARAQREARLRAGPANGPRRMRA